MKIKEKKELKAIHSKDLDDLLTKSGQLDDFKNGNISCFSCHIQISTDNIGKMKFSDGKFYFVCQKPECSSKFTNKE